MLAVDDFLEEDDPLFEEMASLQKVLPLGLSVKGKIIRLKTEQKIFAGMIPELDNAFTALNSGVKKVVIGLGLIILILLGILVWYPGTKDAVDDPERGPSAGEEQSTSTLLPSELDDGLDAALEELDAVE